MGTYIQKIIVWGVLVALTGASCPGAAWNEKLTNAAQRVRRAIWGNPNEELLEAAWIDPNEALLEAAWIDPNEALLEAAKDGYFNGVKQALQNGADKDFTDENGRTALIWAASKGQKNRGGLGTTSYRAIVTELLNKEANVNIADAEGRTALMEAIMSELDVDALDQKSEIKLIDALIKAGAEINVAETVGKWTPLMMATFQNNPEAVRTLLENGAEKNPKNSNGRTALDSAKYFQKNDIIPILENYEPLGG